MPHPLHQFVCATALSVTLGCGVVTAIQSGRGARPLISHIQEAIGSLPADCGYFNALATGDEARNPPGFVSTLKASTRRWRTVSWSVLTGPFVISYTTAIPRAGAARALGLPQRRVLHRKSKASVFGASLGSCGPTSGCSRALARGRLRR